jgi:type VI secretion system secreted protein VgrG
VLEIKKLRINFAINLLDLISSTRIKISISRVLVGLKPPNKGLELAAVLTLTASLCAPAPAMAAPLLGSAQAFAVLGAATVTNTGPTTIHGNLGVSPGSAITGLESITLYGTANQANAAADLAETDAMAAYAALAALPDTANLTGQDLGSVGVLTPGVYAFDAAAQLTGTLRLNFAGDPDTPFVFQVGSALTLASAANVIIENGGPTSAVYWDVGSSATLGTASTFAGNLLAQQSVTFDAGASMLCGRAIALTAAVTMDSNAVSNSCVGAGDFGSGRSDFGSYGFSGGVAPEPVSWALMLVGFGGLGAALRASRRRFAARA